MTNPLEIPFTSVMLHTVAYNFVFQRRDFSSHTGNTGSHLPSLQDTWSDSDVCEEATWSAAWKAVPDWERPENWKANHGFLYTTKGYKAYCTFLLFLCSSHFVVDNSIIIYECCKYTLCVFRCLNEYSMIYFHSSRSWVHCKNWEKHWRKENKAS